MGHVSPRPSLYRVLRAPLATEAKPLAWRVALGFSMAIHGVGAATCAWWCLGTGRSANDGASAFETTVDVAVENPASDRGSRPDAASGRLTVPPTPAPAHPGFRGRESRPDTGRRGRGGSDTTRSQALNLADTVDGITLERDILSSTSPEQLPRTKTANSRQSWDDRTRDPRPMELILVSRARKAASAPGVAAKLGVGDKAQTSAGLSAADGEVPGALGASLPADPGNRGARRIHVSATITPTRPLVASGQRAVPTTRRGPTLDTVNSTQQVSSLVQALVHASTAGGRPGPESGGQNGPTTPGSGGWSGPGSIASPTGNGTGDELGQDPQAFAYFASLRRKVDRIPRDAFPTWAIARGLGGLTTVGLVLLRDGRVAEVRVLRPSGIDEYDRKVVEAVKRAAPYGPVPSVLAAKPLVIRLTFDATNPAVGRSGPGPGQWHP
jgi:TonB family protein